jgi:hypothetical protein
MEKVMAKVTETEKGMEIADRKDSLSLSSN